jgi:DNA polymerase I
MTDHPVPGTACVVFKVAGNRLDQFCRRHQARMLIALHDAYIYEAPLENLREVGELTRRVMTEVVEEYFPALRPRAEINDQYPARAGARTGTSIRSIDGSRT